MVVVAVIIVLALVLTGVWMIFGAPGHSGAGTFSASRGTAQSAANGATGGPWSLLLVLGVATQGSFSGSVANATAVASSLTSSSCSYTPSSGSPATLGASGVGNVSRGLADAWVYLYSNASGSILLVTVVGSSATVVGTISGSSCDLASLGFSAVPSSGIIDSTTASADADAAGGYAFLSAHPQANATFVLLGGFTYAGTTVGPIWTVELDACALTGVGPATASALVVILSATDGTVIQSQTSTVTCPATGSTGTGGTPVDTALTLGSPGEAQKGSEYWYNFSVTSADGQLTWASTTLTVDSNGVVLSLPTTTGAVLSLTGTALATFSFGSSSWSGASSGAVSSQETLSVESPSSLSGDTLVVQGSGSYSGNLQVPIP